MVKTESKTMVQKKQKTKPKNCIFFKTEPKSYFENQTCLMNVNINVWVSKMLIFWGSTNKNLLPQLTIIL